MLGAILNSKTPTKNVGNVSLNRPQKEYLLTVWELKQEAEQLHVQPQPERAQGVSSFPLLCTVECLWMTGSVVSIDSRVTNKS